MNNESEVLKMRLKKGVKKALYNSMALLNMMACILTLTLETSFILGFFLFIMTLSSALYFNFKYELLND